MKLRYLTLLHSALPRFYGGPAVLSAIGLKVFHTEFVNGRFLVTLNQLKVNIIFMHIFYTKEFN